VEFGSFACAQSNILFDEGKKKKKAFAMLAAFMHVF